MSAKPALDAILAAQRPSGAFASVAHPPCGPRPDENAFVTALVLIHLCALPPFPKVAAAIERASDFLLQCQHPRRPGAFCFYPPAATPDWLGTGLGPDADDTALAALALYRAGRWQRNALRRVVQKVLAPYLIGRRPPGPPWFRAGVYPTWLDAGRLRNPIDVCVNLNVATLLHEAGCHGSPAQAAMIDMAGAALDWAGDSPERARQLVPYYPDPAELRFALERAASAGVPGAAPLLARAGEHAWSSSANADAPVCGGCGGLTVWTSPCLQAIRALGRLSRTC